MNGSRIRIVLDENRRTWSPGRTLAGEYRLEGMMREDIRAVEWSVLWYTEGKGDEDMAVHEFKRLSADEGDWIDPSRPTRFHAVLPNSPLSYDGAIVKIRWCVRVRVTPRSGKDVVGETPFTLGAVSPVRIASADPASEASP